VYSTLLFYFAKVQILNFRRIVFCKGQKGQRVYSRNFATIQLSQPDNSALDNIALRTVLALRPLFIKFPLVADRITKRALILLFFRSTSKI
jgi:hypothetical protein